jgi:hypothetical protein
MRISEQKIMEFRELWQKHFNEEISDDFAREQIEKLCSLVKLIYRPIKRLEKV